MILRSYVTAHLEEKIRREALVKDWGAFVNNRTIAIEVKWTDRPSLQDVTSLNMFLRDHPHVREAYVVCRCPRPARLSHSITAFPWQLL